MSHQVDIQIDNNHWPDVAALIERAIKTVLADHDDTEVSILLTGDDYIQTLNAQYRNKDKPTNVLSFPQGEPGMLGDIALALETITREAEAQSKSFDDHLMHLVVHGCLHLLGHDHEEDSEAKEMEALEIDILARLGVKNPYETVSFCEIMNQ